MFSKLFVLLVSVLIWTSISIGSRPQQSVTPIKQTLTLITGGEVEAVVNEVRVQNGLKSLTDNPELNASAKVRADYLCDNDVWSHDGWVKTITFKYRKIGENLEFGDVYQTPRTIVQSWVKSPTHYANMTDSAFTEQGMGVRYCDNYQGLDNRLIVVNHFRLPE